MPGQERDTNPFPRSSSASADYGWIGGGLLCPPSQAVVTRKPGKLWPGLRGEGVPFDSKYGLAVDRQERRAKGNRWAADFA